MPQHWKSVSFCFAIILVVFVASTAGAQDRVNQVPYATPKAVETTLEFIAGEEPKARGADPKQFLDESLVREVEASGFIKALYAK
jgi:hypothetical protein